MNRVPVRRYSRPPTVSANKRLLFLLIGIFLIVAPASVSASTSAIVSNLKWVRVGVLIAMFLTGLRWFRLPRLSDLAGKTLLMSVVFALAALWSTSPWWGLLFKGMLVCAVCASVCLANCLRSEADFRALARTMTFSGLVGAAIVGYLIFVSGDYEIWQGRLIVAQINANSLAMSASIFVLLCVFHLLVRDRGIWALLPILLIALMCILIIYSGSRAAVLTVAAGGVLLLPAVGRTRRHTFALGVISLFSLVVLAVVWFNLFSEPGYEPFFEEPVAQSDESLRILNEMTKDTRMEVWSIGMRNWRRSGIVLGAGWLHHANRWLLVQSSYLQVAVEAGLPGVFCVFVFLVGGIGTLRRAMFLARRRRGFGSTLLYLFAATFFAVAFHGVFESSMVVGSTPNAILLGVSAAQLDALLRPAPAARRQVPPIRRRGPELVQRSH